MQRISKKTNINEVAEKLYFKRGQLQGGGNREKSKNK